MRQIYSSLIVISLLTNANAAELRLPFRAETGDFRKDAIQVLNIYGKELCDLIAGLEKRKCGTSFSEIDIIDMETADAPDPRLIVMNLDLSRIISANHLEGQAFSVEPEPIDIIAPKGVFQENEIFANKIVRNLKTTTPVANPTPIKIELIKKYLDTITKE